MVSASQPSEVDVHGVTLKPTPLDWVTVDFHRKLLAAEWDDGSYVHVNGGDLVHISARNFQLDVHELVATLAKLEFEAANFRQIRLWDNPKGAGLQGARWHHWNNTSWIRGRLPRQGP